VTRGTQLVLLSFAIGLLLAIAYVVRSALLVIYVSAVFAVVLTPAVNVVHRVSLFGWRPSKGAAILIILTAIVTALTLLFVFAIPPIVSDLKDLGTQLPQRLANLRNRMNSVPIVQSVNLRSLEQYFGTVAGGVASLVTNTTQAVVTAAAIITLTAYLILDGDRAFNWMMSLFPGNTAERLRPTLLRAGARMRRWLIGQTVLMLILGSASAVAFGLIGIRYFYLLAVFAGVANIIPLLGPIVSFVLASLIALTDSLWKMLGILVFYVAYQQIENAFLTPRIMKAQVGLSPSAVLVALLVGAELAGVMGALVAIPSAILLSEIIGEYVATRESSPPEKQA
jgi:predicted PurR-regulated permease PerM